MSSGYLLLDSGDGKRLEQFGERRLTRPSSLAIWKPRSPKLWAEADAAYDHEQGWSYRRDRFEEWTVSVCGVTLVLRLQRNGQIGFFPEHSSYMGALSTAVSRLRTDGKAPALLNLFAYTGLATLVAAKAGATVTHVDLLKPALDWAKTNALANQLSEQSLRLIPEEALVFLEREVKREKQYEVIVLDPPSFSRIGKNKSWDLPDILPKIVSLTSKLIVHGGEIFFTSHGTEHGANTVENLYRDVLPAASYVGSQLVIPEFDSPRSLSTGFLVHVRL